MTTVLTTYLNDYVKYNEKHSHLNNDLDADGKACWELSETMTFLFADKQDEKGTFVLYYFEGPTQFHEGVLYNGIYYDMINGSLYKNSIIHTDEYLEEHSSNICKEQMKIKSKTNYILKTKEESEKSMKELNECPVF